MMAENENESASNGDEQSSNGDEQQAEEATGKTPKTFRRRATGSLRQARRTVEASEWEEEARVRHLVAEANVLALLELADAIRSGNEPTSSTDT